MLPVALLCLGASLGAIARWQLSLWLNAGTHWLPVGTLTANLAGVGGTPLKRARVAGEIGA